MNNFVQHIAPHKHKTRMIHSKINPDNYEYFFKDIYCEKIIKYATNNT